MGDNDEGVKKSIDILTYKPGVSVYPETETRVTDLSVSDGYLIMIRFWTWIV